MESVSHFEVFFSSTTVFLPILSVAAALLICTMLFKRTEHSASFSYVLMGFCNGTFCAYLWARGLQATPIQLSIVLVLISTPIIALLSGKLSFKSGSIASGAMAISFVCSCEYYLRALQLDSSVN
jgi:hypothetical protein